MGWTRTVLTACGTLAPDSYRPPAAVLFPYAHIVGDSAPAHVKHLLRIQAVAKFRSDVDFLCRRYQSLPLSDLERVPRSPHGNGPPRYFALSFDDGMREVHDVIAPILREKGVPATFFLNSATIDNKQLMWRHKISLIVERARQRPRTMPPQLAGRPGDTLDARLKTLRFAEQHLLDDIAGFFELDFDEYLRTRKPYLTSEQVQALAREGFEFGSHSDSHPYFNEIPLTEQREQISRSVGFIRGLGVPCRYFAFPFNDRGVPAAVFRHMQELDVVYSFGTSEAREDSVPFSFQRFALDAQNADSSVEDVLKQLSAKSLALRLSGNALIRRN